MQKYFAEGTFYELPSGNKFHPRRLIIRDGTLTWQDALRCKETGVTNIPTDLAHEQHIIKTAQRLEELNTWVSQGRDLWECIKPHRWFNPAEEELSEGICCYFKHTLFSNKLTINGLKDHTRSLEELEERGSYLFFRRC